MPSERRFSVKAVKVPYVEHDIDMDYGFEGPFIVTHEIATPYGKGLLGQAEGKWTAAVGCQVWPLSDKDSWEEGLIENVGDLSPDAREPDLYTMRGQTAKGRKTIARYMAFRDRLIALTKGKKVEYKVTNA